MSLLVWDWPWIWASRALKKSFFFAACTIRPKGIPLTRPSWITANACVNTDRFAVAKMGQDLLKQVDLEAEIALLRKNWCNWSKAWRAVRRLNIGCLLQIGNKQVDGSQLPIIPPGLRPMRIIGWWPASQRTSLIVGRLTGTTVWRFCLWGCLSSLKRKRFQKPLMLWSITVVLKSITGPGSRPLNHWATSRKQNVSVKNLLMVDFSGRSVVAVGPTLKITNGVPRESGSSNHLIGKSLRVIVQTSKRYQRTWRWTSRDSDQKMQWTRTDHRQAFEPVLIDGESFKLALTFCEA